MQIYKLYNALNNASFHVDSTSIIIVLLYSSYRMYGTTDPSSLPKKKKETTLGTKTSELLRTRPDTRTTA